MIKRNEESRSIMKYEIMDCTDLKYPDSFFDVAIDKSTIDTLLCGDDGNLMVAKMTKEVQRVLKPDGVYVTISYGKPELRIPHF
jgi:ubiquinone/menaquinone biosynthesis C-methylase UbiE